MKIIAFPSVASVTTAAAVSHIPLTFASCCSYYGPVSPFTEKSQVVHLCFIDQGAVFHFSEKHTAVFYGSEWSMEYSRCPKLNVPQVQKSFFAKFYMFTVTEMEA